PRTIKNEIDLTRGAEGLTKALARFLGVGIVPVTYCVAFVRAYNCFEDFGGNWGVVVACEGSDHVLLGRSHGGSGAASTRRPQEKHQRRRDEEDDRGKAEEIVVCDDRRILCDDIGEHADGVAMSVCYARC